MKLHDSVWGLGVRARNLAKRLGLLGSFEPVLLDWGRRLLPPPSEPVEVALPYGMTMSVPAGYPAARSFATGLYERDVFRLFLNIVRQGMAIVDVGASVGYYTLLASQLVGPSGHVYAFEPDPKTLDYLLRNLHANRCSNVTVVERAISDQKGSGILIRDPTSDERNWLTDAPPGAVPSIGVQTITLDEFFAEREWPPVHIVKMDIEGSESAALEGMIELSRRNPELQLIMEWDVTYMRRAGTKPEALVSAIRTLGFAKGYIIERGLKPFSLGGMLPRMRGYYNCLFKKD